MKPDNIDKMIQYIATPVTELKAFKELRFNNADLDELIDRLGRKLSFLKAVRGHVDTPRPDVSSPYAPRQSPGTRKVDL